MFFTWNRSRESELYEARIADLKAAHEQRAHELYKLVEVLAEQVEYLRMTVGRPQFLPQQVFGSPIPSAPEYPAFPNVETSPALTEEEEDLAHMHAEGLLDAQDLQAALSELGLAVPTD